ncbi:MAG: hypothetical protein KBE04_09840 [Phycisphaerae bacterium]|nr:hypothetical protein [Phycisphaerae bacterium]
MSIERRVQKVEELVGVQDKGCPVITIRPPYQEGTVPDLPGPTDQWITFKRALAEARKARMPCVFMADPVVE